jgi:alanine-glyoxylate transaminase/serine-glyoxylate transaminase/serine-pyruvate transaminase
MSERMTPEPKLFLPGPTPVPMAIWQAMLTPMSNHRGREITELHASLRERLKRLWSTSGPVVILPASGTGGLEALLANAVAPSETVLAVSAGAFGDRFGQIAERLGMGVEWLRRPWGEAVDPDDVATELRRRRYAAVLLTHNETSTGVLHPLRDLARAARAHVPLILVDSISGSPAVPLDIQGYGVDAVVTGTQKGFMLPPGLAMIGLGEDAPAKLKGRPSLYMDFKPYMAGDWPYTPALSLLHGLDRSLELLAAETEPVRYRRHRLMSAMVRAGAEAAGFRPVVRSEAASPTVTALEPPEGITPKALRAWCQAHGAVLAGGQGAWKDRIVRIGHVGATGPLDVLAVLGVMELAVCHLSGRHPDGSASRAALDVWHRTLNNPEEEGIHD